MSPPQASSEDLQQPQYYDQHTIITVLRENQWKLLLFIRCYEKYMRVVFLQKYFFILSHATYIAGDCHAWHETVSENE